MISLENIDEYIGTKQVINSPRSLEACARLGLNPKELVFKPMEEFKDKNLEQDIVKMRYQHHEQKRKEHIYKAKKERQDIIKMIETHGDNLKPGSFIQPILALQHSNLDFSKSVLNSKQQYNGGPQSPLSNGKLSAFSQSPKYLKALNPSQTQPQLSMEQSRIMAFQQLQKSGIIDDNYYKRFAQTQKIENRITVSKVEKDIDIQLRIKEFQQKELGEEIRQLMKIEEEHQNFHYKTRQKIKREQDHQYQKNMELLQQKQAYKKDLEGEIQTLVNQKQKQFMREIEKQQVMFQTDQQIREKLYKIRQLQNDKLQQNLKKISIIEKKIEHSSIYKSKTIENLMNMKKQKRAEKEMSQKRRLEYLQKEKEQIQAETLEKIMREDDLYERRAYDPSLQFKFSEYAGGTDGGGLFDKRERFQQVKKEGEKLLKQRQEDLIERMKKTEEVQKQKLEEKEKKGSIKKEMMQLKELSKEENIKRHQRRVEYKKELYLQKLKAEQQTFNEARKLKNDVIQERYYNHMIDEIKKHQVKEQVEKMYYTKKFDKEPLSKIAEQFDFLTEPNTQQVQEISPQNDKNSGFNKTAGKSMFASTNSKSIFNQNRGHSSQTASRMSLKSIPIKIEGGKRLHKALQVIQRNQSQASFQEQKPYSAQHVMRKNFSQAQVLHQENNQEFGMNHGGTNTQQNFYITSGSNQNAL
eukprot:403367581